MNIRPERAVFRPLLALAIAGVIAAPLDAQLQHPVERFRRVQVKQVERVSLTAPLVPDVNVDRVKAQSASGSGVLSIGALDDPPEQVFGAVTDVEVDAEGNAFVLDSRNSVIGVFDPRGRHVQTVGGPGTGPGEFRTPKAIAFGRDRRLYVADAARRVHIFDWRSGAYRFTRTATLTIDAVDLCVIGNEVVVQGMSLTDSTVLHVHDLELAHRRSFGVVYRSGDAMIDFQSGQGRVTCAADSRLIVMTPLSMLGEVRAYSLDGVERWVTRIDGMRPIGYSSTGSSFTATVPEQGYHRFRSVTFDGRGSVYVQISLETVEGRRERRAFDRLTTIRLDVTNGRGAPVSVSTPLLAELNRALVSFTDDPFPLVRLSRARAAR